MKLSLCMIVKNEEDVLERCLKCAIKIADEIIIVDTGSTDNTKKIATNFTNKVYDFEWVSDFSKARNFSFSKATKDYIMWLDADDVITEENIKKIKQLKKTLKDDVDMVMLKYATAFNIKDEPSFIYYRERIMKKSKEYKWESPVHEVISPVGNVIYSDACIYHKKKHSSDPKRNLEIFKKMISDDNQLNSRQNYYYARELYYNKYYKEAIPIFINVLNNPNSWIENKISACLEISICYSEIGDIKNTLYSLLRSFEFDLPRAEICSHIGNYFLKEANYQVAIFWYNMSTTILPNLTSGAFIQMDYYNYIPYINLAVCYDKLQNYEMANMYNDLAGKYKPNDEKYLANKKYFESIVFNK